MDCPVPPQSPASREDGPFASVVARFAAGDLPGALSAVARDGTTSLDDLERGDASARLLLNALDAVAFAPIRSGAAVRLIRQCRAEDGLVARAASARRALDELLFAQVCSLQHLRDLVAQHVPSSFSYRVALSALVERDPEHVWFDGGLLTHDVANASRLFGGEGLDGPAARLLDDQLAFVQRVDALRSVRPKVFEPGERPAFPLAISGGARRALVAEVVDVLERGGTPIVFVEPFACDWRSVFAALDGRPAVLAFADTATLHHAAALDGVFEALLDRKHTVVVLDRHPSDHVSMDRATSAYEVVGALDAETAAALGASFTAFAADATAGDWLYRVGRRVAYRRSLTRLGASRAVDLAHTQQVADWYDPQKGQAPEGAPLGAPLDDRVDAVAATLRPAARRSLEGVPQRVRVAHVIGTLVDQGHSPTDVLRTLVEHRDAPCFDLTVVVTEDGRSADGAWPVPLARAGRPGVLSAAPTAERAPVLLNDFAKQGVATLVLEPHGSFEERAGSLAKLLAERDTDIVVFHGNAVFNTLGANACDAPLIAFLDYGTITPVAGFDLVIASSGDAGAKHADALRTLGTELVVNEMVVDVTAGRDVTPLERAAFGAADGHIVLTTVSNHLERRASAEFVAAVAAVMQRYPDAYYMPMGSITNVEAYTGLFAAHGVADRVRPLGVRRDTLRVLASSDLYFNEFPNGSGVAVLEAMATGCPVVTMHDTRGESQGWAGAMYYGIDRAVRSCDPRDYVELACRLLADASMWDEWSSYGLERYRVRNDPAAYVRRFERALTDALARRVAPETAQPKVLVR